ncbi:MAG: MFS transporter, partial [Burkholderiales bacterium]|nr:MFS transporter [Burkholderiales bacterium]
MTGASFAGRDLIDSRFAAWRLVVALILMTIGGAGMYVVPVVLPVVQAEFGVARGDVSLAYTLLMIGFGVGGVLMGRLADRFGIMLPILIGAVCLSLGFVAAAFSGGIVAFMLVHGILIGLMGSAATFAPLIADASQWFEKRRGIAVAVCASGNYLAGTVWPPIVQAGVEAVGWRSTYLALAGFVLVSMTALALTMRMRPPPAQAAASVAGALASDRPFGFTPGQAQALLCVAGIACCVAMSMPQVHIVAYCGDLGYGAARGAQMLSLMLGFGVLSRLISGAICDRIGGLRTLLLGSTLQCVALFLFLPFDSLWSLYLVSALFGL